MRPGRRLDDLIAEAIMGWRWVEAVPEDTTFFGGCWRTPDSPFGEARTPHYSTDIAAAWKVVEKITEIKDDGRGGPLPSITLFAHWWDNAYLWASTAEEAAHMICLAALKAKGITINQEE